MNLATASKIAARELRAAPGKFLFVIVAVAIGVAALCGVKGFGSAVRSMLLKNEKQLIAADVQAQVFRAPSAEQVAAVEKVAKNFGSMTRVTEVVSMSASSHSPVPQLVSVKAVDPAAYPYYGHLRLAPQRPLSELLANDASVVVTPELLIRMKAHAGDAIRLGGREYRIAGELLSEPDRLASGFGPGMRVLVSRAGLDRSGLVQFGARGAQRFLFRLKPGADLDRLKAQLKPLFPRVFITDYREGSPVVARALDSTTTFLSLVSLIALIVGSLGVAMATHSHLQQHMDTIAVMKAIGARANQVIRIYLLQTLWLGAAGALIGIAVGALIQKAFPILLQQIFAFLPGVSYSWAFAAQGMCLGLLSTVLFTLPPLENVRNIRPNLVLRRNMDDASAEKAWRRVRGGFLGLLILAGFGGIAIWVSGSWRMGAYFIAGLAASVFVLGLISGLLLFVLRRVVRLASRQLPAALRHGFANLYRPGNQARAVLVALGVGVMFTLLTFLLQQTVLREVRSEGPGRSGNVFLLDVRNPTEVGRMISAQPGVEGKVSFIGGVAGRMIPKHPGSETSYENMRIATVDAMPDGLRLKQGRWWAANTSTPQFAISERMRNEYHLKLRDNVNFQVAGQTMSAPVVAVFDREPRSPTRFDFVLPNTAMKSSPVVYYGAVRVDPGKIPPLEEALFDKFPTVTVMNLADVFARIQEAVDQVALVIRFVAAFAIVAGLIILCASIAGTRYARIREVAILKTVGGTRRKIISIFSTEFFILGAVSGAVGGLLANIFARVVSQKFLDATFQFDWVSWLGAIAGTAVLASLAGWIPSAGILSKRPLEVLRDE